MEKIAAARRSSRGIFSVQRAAATFRSVCRLLTVVDDVDANLTDDVKAKRVRELRRHGSVRIEKKHVERLNLLLNEAKLEDEDVEVAITASAAAIRHKKKGKMPTLRRS